MHCSTPPSVPLRDTLRVKWDKVFDDGKFMFKLQVPRVTERNGAICCYRVFIVRIPWGQRLGDLPSPDNLPVISYQQAHNTKKVGAYVAEIFTSDNIYVHSHVIVGDGDSPTAKDAKSMQQCMRCVASVQRALTTTAGSVTVTTTTGAAAPLKEEDDDFLGDEKEQMDQPVYGWNDYGGSKETRIPKKYQNNRSYLDDNRYSELPVPDPDQRLFKRQTEKEFKTENFDRIMSEFPQDSETERLELVKGNELDVKAKETGAELVDLRAEDKAAQIGPLSWQVFDGHLDTSSNYTGFVEMIVHTANDDLVFPAYTDYLPVLKPGPTCVPDNNEAMIELILKVVCGVLSVVLVCLFFICVYHTHQRRKEQQGLEMQTLHATLRNLCQGLKGGRHQLVAHSPPDMPPIAKDELAAAYLERSADSDYGFQREFELLPDCFPDRTMHASEARENTSKNRYPDIKAYDQTRVKLAQIDSIVGSDYINANYVMGYKERKRFICAQGPTDATVTDFWRMIWEQNLDLVVMLTNLEEYSKVKCSKYWPDEAQGEKVFGSIAVQHLSEKRYSDYIVRELKVTRQKVTSSAESSPIVLENNGIAKRNGAASDVHSTSSSSPSSPKDTSTASCRPEQAASPQLGSTACGERVVRQYHFLMWKDFVAPEYPQAILKFIHRVNAAWSACIARPLLVHCSAGVGRTGTLVALDCLLQQLRAEQHVAVFNTVADLRRQRNFLVQSLKQYIFVYRALVEYAQYGDTEIPASKLKTTVDRLRNTPEGGDCCLMEEEFERIKKPALPETLKSCAAGGGEENACKNRCEASLPFDRNRVILTPIPGRDFSTYINASFIEGYDNSESYIITQDPLPNTVSDFWRMISEQGATTVVMLSELGEGDRKCPRYWDDGSVQYDHITVQYEHSESCPYYTKREFRVTNSKSQEWLSVRQLQYHGWPTVAGQVPEVTRGLAELADAASRFPRNPASGPMVVHCNLGTERSSMFVALCTLITQLRVERRVDVAALARKIRSQRSGCLDTFLQYEFLHRAIVNYAELHNLLEDS